VEQVVQKVLEGKRFALMGFDAAEAESILAALHEVKSFGHVISGASKIPGLNSLSHFDACLINASAKYSNGNAAPATSVLHGKKPALLIGTREEMAEHMDAFAEPNHDILVRPLDPKEVVLRAFRILKHANVTLDEIEPLAPIAGRRMILIADDDAATVVLVSAILKHSNFDCEVAHDGEQTLAMTRKTKPNLVLLDVSMPKMDGFEALAALRRDPLTHDTPVVMVTADHNEKDLIKGFSLGADDYITKPFNSGELMARINRALRSTESIGLSADDLTES
jgi:PleD family two-component response regulator